MKQSAQEAPSSNHALHGAANPIRESTVREQRASDFAQDWAILQEALEPAQLAQLRCFREALRAKDGHPACQKSPLSSEPYTLLRALVAHDFDWEAAAAWYGGEYLDWRASSDVESRLAAWRAELAEGRSRRAALMRDHFAATELCDDKYGVPVVLYRVGVTDMPGLLREAGAEAIQMQWLHFAENAAERLSECCRRHRRFIPGQVQIFDVGDYPHQAPDWSTNMWHGVMGLFEVLKTVLIPNVTRKTFIIRSSFMVRNLYRYLYLSARVVISPTTMALFHFYGQFASEWATELRDELDAMQVLPDFLLTESEEAFAAAEPSGGYLQAGAGGAALSGGSGGEDVTDEDGLHDDDTDEVAGDANAEPPQASVVGVYKALISARQESVLIIRSDQTFWHAHTLTERAEDDQANRGVCCQLGCLVNWCSPSRHSGGEMGAPYWEQLEILGTYEFAAGNQIMLTCEDFHISSGRRRGEDAGHLMLWQLRAQQPMLEELLDQRGIRLHYRYFGGGGRAGSHGELFRVREEIDARSHVDWQTVNMLLSCAGFPPMYARLPHKVTSPSSKASTATLLSLPPLSEADTEGSDADCEFMTPRSQLSSFSVNTQGIREWCEKYAAGHK